MGWKNIRTEFRIKHITQIIDNHICIGSPYFGELIKISMGGKLVKLYDSGNKDIERYVRELKIAEASGELKSLIETPDLFKDLIPCYTYHKGRVILKRCEVFGWPNVCSDGELMYENTFFLHRKEAVIACRRDAKLDLKYASRSFIEQIGEAIGRISKYTKRFVKHLFYFIISNFQ